MNWVWPSCQVSRAPLWSHMTPGSGLLAVRIAYSSDPRSRLRTFMKQNKQMPLFKQCLLGTSLDQSFTSSYSITPVPFQVFFRQNQKLSVTKWCSSFWTFQVKHPRAMISYWTVKNWDMKWTSEPSSASLLSFEGVFGCVCERLGSSAQSSVRAGRPSMLHLAAVCSSM